MTKNQAQTLLRSKGHNVTITLATRGRGYYVEDIFDGEYYPTIKAILKAYGVTR